MNKKFFNVKFILPAAAVLTVFFSCTPEKKVRSFSVDYRMSLAGEAYETNYFSWTYGGETVKDSYDVQAQASGKGSTKKFNEVRFSEPAEDRKAAIPAGLRGLFLYPVANYELTKTDNLQVDEAGGVITVTFVHRGNAYKLTTDANGNFKPLTGAKIARGVGTKEADKFPLKPEFLKSGGDPLNTADIDWSKVPLAADTYSPEAKYHYEGSLKFEFKENVLSITGTLVQK